jgi:hypothetical protein
VIDSPLEVNVATHPLGGDYPASRANWLGAAACALGMLAAGGCGPASSTFTVTGKIVRGGDPIQVRGSESRAGRVEVKLVPQFAGGEAETAIVSDDGSFRALIGDDVPRGRYKVAVLALEPAPPGAPTETGEIDILKGAFAPERTPILRELGGLSQDLGTIDLVDAGG